MISPASDTIEHVRDQESKPTYKKYKQEDVECGQSPIIFSNCHVEFHK